MHEVSVPIISNEECYGWFSDAGYSERTVPNTMMCAGYKEGGKDSCQVSFFPHEKLEKPPSKVAEKNSI